MNPCPQCSRREFVRLALGASVAAGIGSKFGLPLVLGQQSKGAKAKACILFWMQGAQSQIDTWDPKPGTEFGGPFKAIPTASKAIQISEHLPKSARHMDKVSIIRTLNSKDPNHDTATYFLHTGYRENPDLQHPHVGSVILEELGPGKTDLPGCIVLGGDPPAGAAYLAADRGPAIIDRLENPSADLVASTEYFSKGTLDRRWQLLKSFEEDWNRKHQDSRVDAREKTYERARRILASADLKAFDLTKEPEPIKKLYGETPLGRAALLARRLVQSGVRFVELQYGSWDTHSDNFGGHQRLMTDIDTPYAALLEDLSRTGLLQDTMVLLMTEFGRTPRINVGQGRDHWSRNWCACLAGGGVAGGRVVGRTNDLGTDIEDRPVSVGDLYATLYHAFGVDIDKKYMTPGARPVRVLDAGDVVRELF
ncbi:MAG TPA: DUF1501 domain-containing protein [Planctomycetota bacterium]|nr:DUF1501 domain-containing protein [Planctomycetota bacterium]